jgi:hypothetical protein
MNDSGITQANPELVQQVESLRRQVFILLLALIVVSGALATYLCYQSRLMGKSVADIKPQAMKTIQTYNQVKASLNPVVLSNFISQVSAYAIAHPEFRPVLQKYGWNPPAPPAAPVAPAAPAAPKK